MALKSLSPADQERARRKLGLPSPPSAEQRAQRRWAELENRARGLRKAGLLSEADLARIVAALLAQKRR